MLRSEFLSYQSLLHERKILQTENYRSNHWKCPVKKVFLKMSQISQENTYAGSSFSPFNKAAVMRACNFSKKRLQHRCFPMIFASGFRIYILKNICERLLLNLCKWPYHIHRFCPFCSSAI